MPFPQSPGIEGKSDGNAAAAAAAAADYRLDIVIECRTQEMNSFHARSRAHSRGVVSSEKVHTGEIGLS